MSSQSPAAVLYDLNGVPLVGSAGSGSAAILTIQGNASGTPVPVSGTVTAANASVSATGAAVPASATYIGGEVQTLQSGLTTGDLYPLSMTTAGLLRVDGSNVTQPVSGTVTANAGTGSFTVAQATAANLNATVVGSGNFTVVQPTAASLNATVVGTGTGGAVNVAQATAANLNATVIGNTAAGSGASTGLITVQGNASGTPIPITSTFTDTTATGSLTALNSAVSVAVTGQSNAAMQLVAGTLIGTIVPEVSVDGGTTWVATFFDDPSTSNIVSSIVFGSSNTATTRTIVGVGGASNVRVRVSAYTSGSATANLRASFMADPSFLSGGAAGASLPPVITQAGGSVTTSAPTYTNATLNALSLDTSGNLRVLASYGSGTFNVVGTGTAGSPGTSVLTVQGIGSGTPIPVSGTFTTDKSSTSAITSVAGSITSVTLLASNANRVSATFTNDSTSQVYIALASSASATAYTIKVLPNDYWEMPISYTGAVSAIWTSAAGNMRITELTP